MTSTRELLEQGKREELWEKHCGFFDLRISEYMDIQKELLLEQIQLLAKCELGRKLLGNPIPQNLEEFRKNVPLTTYEDYAPYLMDKREDVLPEETYVWTRTSGRSGGDTFKWVPFTRRRYEQFGERVISAMIIASCGGKGDIRMEPDDILLMTTAPPPYTSAYLSRAIEEQAPVRFIPPLDEGEKMEFQERIEKGFEIAMRTGIDHTYALASLLASVGNRFENNPGNIKLTRSMLHPMAILRLLRGFLTAKINRRGMRVSDIWKPKGIVIGGTDTDAYRQAVEHHWGRKTYEGYGGTECSAVALQAWNFKGMTFCPDTNFWEFIPYDESVKNGEDPQHNPKTILMDELNLGIYEVVFTNFQGGIFTRYRIKDLVEVIALRDDELNINLPQVRFYSRSSDVIDLAGMARLTENVIWKAIESSGVQYQDWVVRKEMSDGEVVLHIYIEDKPPQDQSLEKIKDAIRGKLHQTSQEFADFENMLGGDRLLVTRVPTGAFNRYIQEQQQAGADLGQLKPVHMQPSDEQLSRLMQDKG